MTTFLERQIDRRDFLRVAGLTAGGVGIAMIFGGCEDQPSCDGGFASIDCNKIPTLEVNSEVMLLVKNVISPIETLLPKEKQGIRVVVHDWDSTRRINGQPADRSKTIHIFVADELNKRPGEEAYPIVAYHEMIHTFDEQNAKGKKPSRKLDRKGMFWDTCEYDEKGDCLKNKALINLVGNLVDESNYFKIDGGNYIGHPKDNLAELYASTLNTMRFWPSSFLENLKKLKSQEQKRVAQYCLDAYQTLKDYAAHEVSDAELAYDVDLLRGLRLIANISS